MTSEFDAMDYLEELVAAGVPFDQAAIHAKALATGVALIQGDINGRGQRLTALIAEARASPRHVNDDLELLARLVAKLVASSQFKNIGRST